MRYLARGALTTIRSGSGPAPKRIGSVPPGRAEVNAERLVRWSAVLLLFCAAVVGCANQSGTRSGPNIVSTYGSAFSPLGSPYRLPDYLAPHSGVDFGGSVGDLVIAPADGVVVRRWDNHVVCGNGLLLYHKTFELFTNYCHMHEVSVSQWQEVKRGEHIGSIGESGVVGTCRRSGWACPIVHWELTSAAGGNNKAVPGVTSDPLAITVGCFDPAKTYPIDRLVFTYPVPCRD